MEKAGKFSRGDAGYEDRVRKNFNRQGLMNHLGAQLARVEPGAAEIRVTHRSEVTQQHGYFHAGVSGAIADTACGYAAFR